MPTFGFVIDNRKCIGCHACTVACKSEHQVPVGVDRTWVKYIEKGTFPNSRRFFSVMRCNHCEHAPCVTICPVTALYRRDDGVVDFNPARCIRCKFASPKRGRGPNCSTSKRMKPRWCRPGLSRWAVACGAGASL